MKHLKINTKDLSKTKLLTFILVFACIGGYILLSGKAAGGVANLWIDDNGGTCIRSSAPTAYNNATACSSIQAAYSACQSGDVVNISAGTYNTFQNVNSNNASLTSACNFDGQNGVTFTGQGIELYQVSHIKISGVSISSFLVHSNTATTDNDITFDGVSATAFKVNGNVNNVTIKNSIFNGGGNYAQPQIAAYVGGNDATVPTGTTYVPTNLTLSGNTFNNYLIPNGVTGVHTECIQIRDWNGTLNINHNLYYNCDATAYLSFSNLNGSGTANVDNNVFGCGGTASQAVTLPVDAGATINFRYNSSVCKGFGTQGITPPAAAWNITGNYSPFNSTLCYGNNTYNLSTGGHCTGTGNQTVATLDFVDGANNDFHLKAGAGAVDQGGSACLGMSDYYGSNRPQGAACDAGAVESPPLPNLWVSPTGNDSTCARGDQTKPCATFDKAYHIAVPGDTVQVTCGNYSAQQINYDSTKAGSTTYVTFAPASNYGICWNQTDGITIGSDGAANNPSYIYLKNYSYFGGINNRQLNNVSPTKDLSTIVNSSDFIKIENQNGGTFAMVGAQNFQVLTADVGNCVSNALGTGGGGGVLAQCEPRILPSLSGRLPSGVIDHLKSHDLASATGNPECGSDGTCHTTGFNFSGADGVTIRHSQFYNNVVADMRLQSRGGTISNVTIENSWFDIGNGPDASSAQAPVQADSEIAGLVFRFNSFSHYKTSDDRHSGTLQCIGSSSTGNGGGNNCGTDASHAKIYGNLMGYGSLGTCPGNSDVSYNVFWPFSNSQDGINACGGTNTLILDSATVPFYTSDPAPNFGNVPNNGVPNYTITGPNWVGDNFVPCGNLPAGMNCPSTDYYGSSTRPLDTNADAGAVERSLASGNNLSNGDLNSDSHVTILDLSILLSHYGQSATPSQGDINNDGMCSIVDLSILLSHYGT